MSDATPAVEQSARRISPLLFAVALLGFFLTFTAVSCNSDAARPLLATASGFGASNRQIAAINRCVDSLSDYRLADYSGIALAVGGKPSVASAAPRGCRELTRGVSAPTSVSGGQAKLGVQPLALIALIATALGIVLTIAYFVRSPRSRARALVTAAIATGGLVLVLLEQFLSVSKAFDDRLDAAVGPALSSLPIRINLGDYFNVSPGAGFYVIVAALGVALFWNLGAATVGTGAASYAPVGAAPPQPYASAPPQGGSAPPPLAKSQPPTGPGTTPEERPDVGPPPQPGSEPTPPISVPAQPPPWPGSPGEEKGRPGTPSPPPPHAPG